MNELDLYRSGLDTMQIAARLGRDENEIYNAINRQKRAENEKRRRDFRKEYQKRLEAASRSKLTRYAGYDPEERL